MRVTCPSCRAAYDAPDAEFGAGGRVVECSACGARWMQPGAAEGAAAVASTGPAGPKMPGLAAAAAGLAALDRPDTPDEDAPEAETEAEADDAPAPQPDPGAAAWRSSPPADGPASERPAPPMQPAPSPAPSPEPPAVPAEAAPEIAPSPRPETPPAKADAAAPAPRRRNQVGMIDAQSLSAELRGAGVDDRDEVEASPRSGGGAPFWIGFLLALLIAGVGTVAYLRPGLIGDAVPTAWPMLEQWRDIVNEGRAAVQQVVAAIADLAAPLIDRIR